MADWLEFGRGPLFRLSFALMLLGLLRLGFLAALRSGTRGNQQLIQRLTENSRVVGFSGARFWRPVRWTLLVVFHLGLVAVPLFLGAHVLLWRSAVGFAWWSIPQDVADWLTLLAMAAGLLLVLGGLFTTGRSYPSWPILLGVPFATGYLCANADIDAKTYQWLMLLHVYSGNLILVMTPFTRVADCVLSPLVQNLTRSPWKPLGELVGFPVRPIDPAVAEPRKES